MNRAFGAKIGSGCASLSKGVRKVTLFVAIFHCLFFTNGILKLGLDLCIFPVSTFSIFSVFFLY